ncbi:hypothetical protein ACIBO2_31415 [Nonomuraea sp. NPDC050022]|uniref:hypothetical protein n=1 Tax=unclassified Nonomuraea TaxID=2593643 RepID=UPI0033C84021
MSKSPLSTAVPRGHRVYRALAAFAVVVLLLATHGRDQGPERITSATSKVCRPWKMSVFMNKQPTPAERKPAFVCAVRQRLAFNGRYATVPDESLVKIGRHLCQVSLRHDQREMQTVMERRGFVVDTEANSKTLGYLCPELNRRQTAEEEAVRKREQDVIATARRRCDSLPRHRPPAHPSLQARAMLWVDPSGTLDVLEGDLDTDFPSSFDKASANELVGATPGDLTILTADEETHVCATVEVYDERPRVEVERWEKVVEVGYVSPEGEMVIIDGEEQELPNLALHGAGRYRVRVHTRGAKAARAKDGDARQEFLIVVYPGTSARTQVLK